MAHKPLINTQNKINKHGLPVSITNGKLKRMINNTMDYRPDELARHLVKLAYSLEPQATINAANALEVSSVDCSK